MYVGNSNHTFDNAIFIRFMLDKNKRSTEAKIELKKTLR